MTENATTTARIFRGPRIGLAPVVTCAGFAAVGLMFGDRMSLYASAFFGILFSFGVVVYVRMRTGRGPCEALTVDDVGVTRTAPGLREHVAWTDVVRVRIVTTDQGPSVEDVFFLIDGSGGTGCAVPQDLAVEGKLLEALQNRLDGLNNGLVIEAMSSTSNREFIIWSRQTQQQ